MTGRDPAVEAPQHEGHCCFSCMGDYEAGEWPLEDNDGNQVCCCKANSYRKGMQ
jgi:hypothetical protein